MSQHGRHDYPTAIHLVSVRGQPDHSIFFSTEMLRQHREPGRERLPQLQFWEHLVARACDRYEARVHAYTWLPNEALLLLQRFDVPLDVLVASVLGQYSRYLHEVGRMPKDTSPYSSRYESVEVTPGVLPYGVRHLYWRAVWAEFSVSPIEYPLCSYALHYAEVAPPWFEQKDFIAGLGQRGYFGRSGGERFLLRPENPRYRALFALRSGRKPRIVGEPVDVQDARWQAEHSVPILSIEEIISAVDRLIREHSTVPLESVLGKSLVTWYATRSGAATLDDLGRWFDCSPTTLRRDIESHRRRRPALFAHSVNELLTAKRLPEDAALTSRGMLNPASYRKWGTPSLVAGQRPAAAGRRASLGSSLTDSQRVQTGATGTCASRGDRAHSVTDIPTACTETFDP
jgi:hypothetical protein